jgi:RNA polymerase sigma-70 factor, ECF subfamily
MQYAISTEIAHRGWFGNDAASNTSQLTQDVKTLISQTLAGNPHAFELLVATSQATAYRVAYRILHSPEAAADAVQEALIKMFYGLATFRGGNFQSWFLRILVNTCYDLLRQQKQEPVTSWDVLVGEPAAPVQPINVGELPDVHLERMEMQRWLARGLDRLPADQRTLVILYDVEGYSYNEIVAFTGLPIGTVKSRLNRGRIKLRDYLLRHNALPR